MSKEKTPPKTHKGKRTEHTDTEARSGRTTNSLLLYTLITEELNWI